MLSNEKNCSLCEHNGGSGIAVDDMTYSKQVPEINHYNLFGIETELDILK